MSLVENMKALLQQKKGASSIAPNKQSVAGAVQVKGQVATNKPQKKSAARGR